MGSLARKNNFILLAAVLAMLWTGLFASPASAAASVEERKMLLLELLGLDTSDTEVIRTAREAQSLYDVEVVPGEDNVNVVLKLSGVPEYDSHLYTQDERMLVVDLANTINLSSTSVFMLGEDDPIKKVRNSQYRVSPRFISRVVLDLDEEVEPEISSDGSDLVISAPVERVMLAAATDDEVDQGDPVADSAVSEAETTAAVPEETEAEEEATEAPAMVAMAEETEEEEAAEEPAAEAPTELEPLVDEEPAPEQTLLTLTFRDADLNAVLDIIARKGKLNIIAGKDIRGAVTVRLVDVPLDVALNAILNVNGYGYVKSDNIVRIVPLSQLGEEVETITATYTLSYADATKARDTLKSFLTPNGSIEIDARTNMLIITDVPNNMERVAKLIPKIDKRVQQVLIEVLILDSVLTDDADLGIQWTAFNTVDNSVGLAGFEDGADLLFGLADPTALNLNFATLIGAVHLEALIQAVVNTGDSRVLANPKLLTLNNETASIEIITEFPYQERTSTSEGGQLVSTSFKDVGTKMDVKPQITHDGHVILNLKPEQSNVVDVDPTNIPIIATRKTETTLIVKDHQTIVVGGLRENTDVVTMKKVPVLGDLPIAKYVFRSVSSRKQDTELLVFITVHIVESPALVPSEKIKFDELGTLPRMPNSSIELIR